MSASLVGSEMCIRDSCVHSSFQKTGALVMFALAAAFQKVRGPFLLVKPVPIPEGSMRAGHA
eukprot:8459398-Alexandrium_andersonii.AAC.1